MAKSKHKRFFSLIFVPDQDRDPKSLSLSYGVGRVLLAVLLLLGLHLVLGVGGYVRLAKVSADKRSLVLENDELKARNRRIDQIAKEFTEIRKTDEKIRKAFGATLGVGAQPDPSAAAARPASPPAAESPAAAETTGNTSLYFLSRKAADFFDPDRLPTLLPVSGVLTTRFRQSGPRPGRNHWGIDIAAPKGTVVQAAGSGVVLLSDWTPDLGNMVILSHGGGFYTYYGHMQKTLVQQGTRVDKGQPIALVGSTGLSSAPHLHFEIWKNGEPVDPETFVYASQKPRS